MSNVTVTYPSGCAFGLPFSSVEGIISSNFLKFPVISVSVSYLAFVVVSISQASNSYPISDFVFGWGIVTSSFGFTKYVIVSPSTICPPSPLITNVTVTYPSGFCWPSSVFGITESTGLKLAVIVVSFSVYWVGISAFWLHPPNSNPVLGFVVGGVNVTYLVGFT